MAPGAPVEDSSEVLKLLKNQVEFYFGNSNLVKDKFLRKCLLKNDILSPFNCVKASVFLTFNKVKDFFRSHASLVDEFKGILNITTEVEGVRIKKED